MLGAMRNVVGVDAQAPLASPSCGAPKLWPISCAAMRLSMKALAGIAGLAQARAEAAGVEGAAPRADGARERDAGRVDPSRSRPVNMMRETLRVLAGVAPR